MVLPSTTGVYNLIEEKWIPVLYCNGKRDRLGILHALTRAGTIRQIAASNPMDRAALLRFLLAVLMWCKESAKSAIAHLGENSEGIPEEWLAGLKEHRDAFNLLGEGDRFYQDKEIKNKGEPLAIGMLLGEFPGADSVNHMRHVFHDGSYGFCPACCALGILRLSVWSPANKYYPASVNPASAAYKFLIEKNLLQTLRSNLPEADSQSDQPPWLCKNQPKSPDAVARLAWRPRKLWLNVDESGGRCACCGQVGTLVKTLYLEDGWPTPITFAQGFGREVLNEFQKINPEYKSKKTERRKMADKVVKIAPVILKCRMSALSKADTIAKTPKNEKPATKIARVFDQLYEVGNVTIIQELTKKPTETEQPLLGHQDTQAKKFWVEDPHLIKEDEPISFPDLSKDVSIHASKFWRDALRLQQGQCGRVTAIGPVVSHYTFHDAVSIVLPDASEEVRNLARLSADCNGNLLNKLKNITKSPQRKHVEIEASIKLLTPSAEAQIRDRMSRISTSSGNEKTDPRKLLHEIYEPLVEQIIASVIPGSPLKRREAENQAKALLNEMIN